MDDPETVTGSSDPIIFIRVFNHGRRNEYNNAHEIPPKILDRYWTRTFGCVDDDVHIIIPQWMAEMSDHVRH